MTRFSTRKSTRLAAALSLLWSGAALGQDSDGDGSADAVDPAPCDAAVVGELYAPARGQYGALLFEDQWPNLGDADFNDAVIAYNYVLRTNQQGQVIGLTANFDVLALGGTFDNGLGLHLPAPAQGATVTRSIAGGPAQALRPSGSDAELTVRVSDNLRELFGGQPGQINSISGPSMASGKIVVEVQLGTPVSPSIVAEAPFDAYLFRTGDPTHQIHRTRYAGTSNMNAALFGTGSDNSSPGNSFVDQRNLPFVLDIPALDTWPAEATDIALLFPNIIAFATSGGVTDQDFYATGVDHTQAYAGSPAVTPGAVVGAAPDAACTVNTDGDLFTDGEELLNGTSAADAADPQLPATLLDLTQGDSYSNHTCMVDWNGKLTCLGDYFVVNSVPSDLEPVVAIESRHSVVCALLEGGGIRCFGRDLGNMIADAPTTGAFQQIAMGDLSVCAIDTAGGLTCWGRSAGSAIALNAPTGTFVAVDVGRNHACALSSTGQVQCWGTEYFGEISNAPQGTFTAVGAGDYTSCALDSAGALQCWGSAGRFAGAPASSGYTSLEIAQDGGCVIDGAGTMTCWRSTTAYAPPPGGPWAKATFASNSICGVDVSGRAACTGFGNQGSVGGIPAQAAGPLVHVASANETRCGLYVDGSVDCWGVETFGSVTGAPSGTFVALDSSQTAFCALDASGAYDCWGHPQTIPSSGGTYARLSMGSAHGCGLNTDGSVACWSDRAYSDGRVSGTPGGGSYRAVNASAASSCAIDGSSQVSCWGYDNYGAVSNAPSGPWASLHGSWSAGGHCALDAAGAMRCWGDDRWGQASGAPTSAGWIAAELSGSFACGIDATRSVTCWGSDGTGVVSGAPTAGRWASLYLTQFAACAIDVAGAVHCWGANTQGDITGRPQAAIDSDRDGLWNSREYELGTDAFDADTDGDGRRDGFETIQGTNPLVMD